MVDVTIEGANAVFEVEGWDKLWALRSRLTIPLSHIAAVKQDDDAAKGWWHGVKVGGADLPGVITAGSFFRQGRLVFYDVHKPDHTIVVDLAHESYDKLVLQVRDPAAAVKLLAGAISNRA
ncbi:MAG TPA: hypothetical protein VG916_14255 [Gemmatimonadaceae bacterium]|nr:hypothetical protein [Gemmatimonadaceae bacterium]